MPSRFAFSLHLLVVLLLLGMVSACTPSLSPLYRDYEVKADSVAAEVPEDVYAQIRTALQDAGWEIADSAAPNVVTTAERKMNTWIFYKIVASLEVAPFGDGFVRVYIHPYRHYVGGSRSKLPYLKRNLERIILSDLNPAFEEQGLVYIGTTMAKTNVAAR